MLSADLARKAFPGGYAKLLAPSQADQVAGSFRKNVKRRLAIKRRYDPANLFRSAVPLPS